MLLSTKQNNTFYDKTLFMQKWSNLHNTSVLRTQKHLVTPFFVLNNYSNAEMLVFHQIVCILACSKQNNTFYTINLFHAKMVIYCLIRVFKNTLAFSKPAFCSKSLFYCRNACFLSNSILAYTKQNNTIHKETLFTHKRSYFA